MANQIAVTGSGRETQTVDGVETVADALEKAGFDADGMLITVNGDDAALDTELSDYQHVILSQKTKGA